MYIFTSKTMTFEESVSKCEQIKSYVIGLPIKEGKRITSLFIGSTNWDRMCDHMNMQNQKGHEIARIKFANEGFSVYGVSVDNLRSYTNYGLVLLDDFDKMSK